MSLKRILKWIVPFTLATTLYANETVLYIQTDGKTGLQYGLEERINTPLPKIDITFGFSGLHTQKVHDSMIDLGISPNANIGRLGLRANFKMGTSTVYKTNNEDLSNENKSIGLGITYKKKDYGLGLKINYIDFKDNRLKDKVLIGPTISFKF
ncbi:hypothetical protein K8R33_01270 [archaeon]|nr:hypothetical protein [archaeon]